MGSTNAIFTDQTGTLTENPISIAQSIVQNRVIKKIVSDRLDSDRSQFSSVIPNGDGGDEMLRLRRLED